MKLLVIGWLGYHEQNIIAPILRQLRARNVTYHRLPEAGGNFDFFRPDIPAELIVKSWCHCALEASVSAYDGILFVDFWNYAVPMVNYLRYRYQIVQKTVLMGIAHGSVVLPYDVALAIPGSIAYEQYLVEIYDTIFLHADWAESAFNGKAKIARFPFNLQFQHPRPDYAWQPHIVYAHRWAYDKGVDRFIDFLKFCQSCQAFPTIHIFADVPHDDPLWSIGYDPDSLYVYGRITQHDLKAQCAQIGGGYAWSSARQETTGYAVWDLISWGYTPLVRTHLAYKDINALYHFQTCAEAYEIVFQDRLCYSQEEWTAFQHHNQDNDARFAQAILESLQPS